MSQEVAVRGHNGTSPTYSRTATPAVDVFESADEVLVIADVPGAARESIDVRVENDMLTLEIRRTSPATEQGPALAREYEEVDWAKSFRISAGIDTAAVTAEVKNGTLFVKLPKAAAAKSRKITVQSS